MWFAIMKETTIQRYMKISIIVYLKVLRIYFIHERVWRLDVELGVYIAVFIHFKILET